MREDIRIPVLALRETVVFPGTAAPITVGRPASVAAVDAALGSDRRLLLVTQRENRDEVTPGILHAVGTIGRIAQIQNGTEESRVLLVLGEQRARIVSLQVGLSGALFAVIDGLDDWAPPDPHDPAFLDLYYELRLRSRELGLRRGMPPEMMRLVMEDLPEASSFTDLIAFYLDIGLEEKQSFLETLSVEARVRRLLSIVNDQIASDDTRPRTQGVRAGEAPPEQGLPQGAAPSGSSIFISYRRGFGAGYVTGRIFNHLVGEFGRDSVFQDVDSIPLGVDFREHIERAVEKCNVFIVVISPHWHERLQDPRDFVRVELETALRRSIPVIPVFLQEAVLPAEDDLPPSLRTLVYRNGLAVRPDPDFDGDMGRLIRGIRGFVNPGQS